MHTMQLESQNYFTLSIFWRIFFAAHLPVFVRSFNGILLLPAATTLQLLHFSSKFNHLVGKKRRNGCRHCGSFLHSPSLYFLLFNTQCSNLGFAVKGKSVRMRNYNGQVLFLFFILLTLF